MSLTELTVFLKIWFELFFYNTVGFSSAKIQEKERENREKKEDRYIFEKHNLLKFIL